MNKLIILPGWGQSKKHWQHIAEQFTDYSAEVLELPGCGEEPLVAANWNIIDYATWVEEQLNKQN